MGKSRQYMVDSGDDIRYAKAYSQSREASEEFLGEICELISIDPMARLIIDLGCGTGDFVDFANSRGLHAIGIDRSVNMIKQSSFEARERGCMIVGDAILLPIRRESVDRIVIINAVHEIGLHDTVVEEIVRVLRVGGKVFIMLANKEEMPHYWEYQLFPAALRIDLKRQPSIDDVVSMFMDSGLQLCEKKRILFETRKLDANFLRRVHFSHISSLWKINEIEYQKGLKRLQSLIRDDNSRELKQEVFLNLIILVKNTRESAL